MDTQDQKDLSLVVQRIKNARIMNILDIVRKQELVSIAKLMDIAGRSKMTKSQLVSALNQYIQNNIREILLLTSPDEWKVFVSLQNKTYVLADDYSNVDYRYLGSRALITLIEYGEDLYLGLSDEVRGLFDKIDKNEFHAEHERFQLVYSYIKAMENLYGVFTPQKLIEIFNSQNSEKIDLGEFVHIYTLFYKRQQSYYFSMGYIVCDCFQRDKEILDLLARAKDKPFYIPEKEEFLRYSDDNYFEMTPQLIALRQFIRNNLTRDEAVIDELIDDIQLDCAMEYPPHTIIDEFNRRNISFSSKQQFKDLMPYITDVYNNTRLWCNRGHKPSEIFEKYERPKLRPLPRNSFINEYPVKNEDSAKSGPVIKDMKVGRNDPCPCGSGKKYKKCCGK